MLHRHSLLIALALTVACAHEAPPPATSSADLLRVPVRTLDGRTTDLAALAKGRVMVASLWAPWCEACRQEEPALRRLNQLAISRGDFVLVSIAIGTTAQEIAADTPPYPRLVDTGAFAEVGHRRVPSTLVIDATGHTVFEGGALDGAALDARTKALAR